MTARSTPRAAKRGMSCSSKRVLPDAYLIHDAHVAAEDARRAGMVTCGIALDEGGAGYMRRIVGREYCRIVSDPSTLPAQLVALFVRIAAS
jgi:nitric oxide reductase NorD protein